jgi:hypothetical protein
VANLGVRPSLDPNDVNGGRVLLETHCLDWPAELGAEGAYGKIIRVELLHKLHDELKYDGLDALTTGHTPRLRRRTRLVRSPNLTGLAPRRTLPRVTSVPLAAAPASAAPHGCAGRPPEPTILSLP